MNATDGMWVYMNFARWVIVVVVLIIFFFLGAFLFSRKRKNEPEPWEEVLEENKHYRILFVFNAWNPRVATMQDEKGFEPPFLVYLPEDPRRHFWQDVVVVKVKEHGKFYLRAVDLSPTDRVDDLT